MKKILTLALALIVTLSLAACGGGEEKPVQVGNTDSTGVSQTDDNGSTGAESTNIPAPGKTTVETKSDRVITTFNDGLSNIAITEYIYKDGALSEIIMTMQCADAAAAKTLHDTYTTGSMKEYGEQLYSDIELDGKNVIHTFNESYLSTFSGMSMEQLAASLDGGDPYAAGSPTFSDDSEIDETVYNYAWNDLTLPDGFPQLDSGVTGITEFDGGCMLTWNAMALSDLEEMIGKLEAWSGLTLEAAIEMEDAKAWSAESDTMTLTVNYYANTFDAQVMISVQTF